MKSQERPDLLEALTEGVGSTSLAVLTLTYPIQILQLLQMARSLIGSGYVRLEGDQRVFEDLVRRVERANEAARGDEAEYKERVLKILNEVPQSSETYVELTDAGYRRARAF